MSRVVAWGTAIGLSASSVACTVLFPFAAQTEPQIEIDTDDRADAATPPVDTCGQIVATFSLPGPAVGVAWERDRLIAAWEGGVDQIDLADPRAPRSVDSLALDGPTGLDTAPCAACPHDLEGRKVANVLVSYDDGVEVLSTEPRLHVVARLAGGAAVDVAAAADGARAVVSFEGDRISVLDLTGLLPGGDVVSLSEHERVVQAPCAPDRVATLSRWGAASVGGGGCEPALLAFRLAGGGIGTPQALELGSAAQDLVAFDGPGLLVALGEGGLRALALGDAPGALVDVPSIEYAYALAVHGHFAFVAGSRSVRILDGVDRSSPTVVGEVELPAAPTDLATSGASLFVALGAEGVAVVDTSCFIGAEVPTDDGRLDGGEGEGEGEGELPPEGPTPCDPAQVAVDSLDGRLQCAAGCLTVPLGGALWCTTGCARDEDCATAKGSICAPEARYCVRECVTDGDCLDVGLHRCDAAGGTCI